MSRTYVYAPNGYSSFSEYMTERPDWFPIEEFDGGDESEN